LSFSVLNRCGGAKHERPNILALVFACTHKKRLVFSLASQT